MKLLVLFLILFSYSAHADNMFGADFNFGGGSRPSYGFDLEKVYGLNYTDIALSGNSGYGQLYLSTGLQEEHVNWGFAIAATMSEVEDHRFGTQVTVGPEIGFMQNITREIYVKENNNYMGAFGRWYLGATLSVGLNF